VNTERNFNYLTQYTCVSREKFILVFPPQNMNIPRNILYETGNSYDVEQEYIILILSYTLHTHIFIIQTL